MRTTSLIKRIVLETQLAKEVIRFAAVRVHHLRVVSNQSPVYETHHLKGNLHPESC